MIACHIESNEHAGKQVNTIRLTDNGSAMYIVIHVL
jgi:hypothetical protein